MTLGIFSLQPLHHPKRITGLWVAASFVLAAVCNPAFAAPDAPLSAMAKLGKLMFYDTSLSGSGKMSCASCHSPANHYSPSDAAPVETGGVHMDQKGLRPPPTLTYKIFTPAFSVGPENPAEELNEASPMSIVNGSKQLPSAVPTAAAPPKNGKLAATSAADQVPRGGLFWDGRVDTLQDQAMGPLMSPVEMANPDIKDLYKRILKTYGKQIGLLAGEEVLKDPQATVAEASFAIARYEIEDPSFHLFNSKYDRYLKGEVKLSPAEMRGLKLFNDRNKGNCADCHLNTAGKDGSPPMFTDYEYEALGVPRNSAIPSNSDPAFFDLGICGPMRTDIYAHQASNCGLFKTPTLRNAATRKSFFHNGVFHSLKDVVRFYARRDLDPALFYPKGKDGKIKLYDDLPARYKANVDHVDPPFTRKPGEKPALNDQEIDDLVAYLKTLTDQ